MFPSPTIRNFINSKNDLLFDNQIIIIFYKIDVNNCFKSTLIKGVMKPKLNVSFMLFEYYLNNNLI
ncbi:MAG: hypothetical protein OHK0038_17910 [Flammeovirgaceae bacterium]